MSLKIKGCFYNIIGVIFFLCILFSFLWTDIPIFGYFMAFIFLITFSIVILDKLNFEIPFNSKLTKNQIIETKIGLNINNNQWKKLTSSKKLELYDYFQRQERIKKWIISEKIKNEESKIKGYKNLLTFHENKKNNLNSIKKKIDREWEILSLDKRIELIKLEERRKLEADKTENNRWEKEKIKMKELNEKRDYEKKLNEEKERLLKQENERKNTEQQLKKEQIEKEEREKLEQIRKKELIEEKRKQKDIEYKERIKWELLEKERKKLLESEAIQELIDNGRLNANFSIQNQRTPIPSHIKDAVWKRDKQSCVNCKSSVNLEFDHIIPVSKGGSNSISNIQLLCQKCNRSKSNKIM